MKETFYQNSIDAEIKNKQDDKCLLQKIDYRIFNGKAYY